jgi:hypothetical protein
MPRTRTSFTKGCQPGPGRPPGSKDSVPRGSVKAAFDEFVAARGGQQAMVDAIERGVCDSRRALGFIELYAKLLKEVGSGADAAIPKILLVPGLDVDTFARGVRAGRSAPEDER